MKHLLLSILLWATTSVVFSQDIINVFYLGSKICAPVRIKCSQGEFYVYNGTRINGNLSYLEAWDCQGNKILDTSADKTEIHTNQPTIRTYKFEYLYSSSQNSSNYQNNNTYHNNKYNKRRMYSDIGNDVIDTFSEIGRNTMVYDVEGYPNLGIEMGLSRFFGEFARLSLAAGGMGGFHLFGGIGKNWIFDFENSEPLAWHVGMGTYISWGGGGFGPNNQAIKLDVTLGETPLVINKAVHFGLNYEYYFGEKTIFGIFGGLGVSFGNLEAKEPEIDWDFQIGIGIKLWSKKG